MPPKFDRCVKRVMDQGKSKDSAYAICVAMWKRTHGGQSPFGSSEALDLSEYEEFSQSMDLEAIEKEMFKEDTDTFYALKNEMDAIENEEQKNKKEETLKKIKQ